MESKQRQGLERICASCENPILEGEELWRSTAGCELFFCGDCVSLMRVTKEEVERWQETHS